MGHYAKVNQGKVVKVIVAEASFFNNFVDDSPGTWIQTSYNTRGGVHYQPNSNVTSSDQSKALRGNYAGIGYEYDSSVDAFFHPQPFSSWTKNTSSFSYEAPIDYPSGDATGSYTGSYSWSESAYIADSGDPKTEGWITSSMPI
jgi:hypothetical protein